MRRTFSRFQGKCFRKLTIFTLAVAATLGNTTYAQDKINVVAITDSNRPFRGIKPKKSYSLSILKLDAVDDVERTLSLNLDRDPQAAQQQIKRRVSGIGQAQFTAQVRQAYQALITAIGHNIDRYPVVVIDGRYAVYGVMDISRAIALYRTWLADHQEAGDA